MASVGNGRELSSRVRTDGVAPLARMGPYVFNSCSLVVGPSACDLAFGPPVGVLRTATIGASISVQMDRSPSARATTSHAALGSCMVVARGLWFVRIRQMLMYSKL